MPMFKGQGCKSSPGKAIDYITDDKKAEIISSQYLDDSRSYEEQFRETAQLYGKGDKFDERKYYHFKLSCDQADNVSASAHHEYAEAMAKRLFPNHECVIATHTDTNTVHSHIIVNAVNFEDGKKLQINDNAYHQMKDIANRLGAERGYSQLIYTAPNREHITRAEKEIVLKGGTSWKEELREVIAEAKAQTTNMTDFEKHLNNYGVKLTRNTENTIAYLHPQKTKAIRGEKLGQDYTKGEILNEFSKSANRQYTEAERTIERAKEQLRAVRTESHHAGTTADHSGDVLEKFDATIEKSRADIKADDSAKGNRIANEQSRQRELNRAREQRAVERSKSSTERSR